MLGSDREFNSPQQINNAYPFYYRYRSRQSAFDRPSYRSDISPRFRVLPPIIFSLAQRSLPSVVPLCIAFLLQHVERNGQLAPLRCRLFTIHSELTWLVCSVTLIGVPQLLLMFLVRLHIDLSAFHLKSTSQTRVFLNRGVA